MSNLVSWAEKEIQLACKNEMDGCESGEDASYGIACYKSALKALKSLAEDGHSGYSIAITKSILNRLIDGLPLSPIYDTEDVWNLACLAFLPSLYQLHKVGIDEHTQSDGHEVGHEAVVSLQSHIGRAQPAHAYQCHAPSFEPVLGQLQAGLSGAGAAPCLVVEAM